MTLAPDIVRLADANLLEAMREHARWQDPCVFQEEAGLIMCAGATSHPGAFKNCVARIDPGLPAQEVVARAQHFFGARGRGFTLFTRDSCDDDLEQHLVSSGHAPRAETPCMAIEAPLAETGMPRGLRIERFREERHIGDALAINAEAYQALGLPPEETQAFYGRPQALLSERVVGFVAYRDDAPVATALTILSGSSAGVYWVGTVAGARRGGLGETCTRLATNAGFASGARIVTLQASPFGEPIYRKMGYTVCDRIKWFRFPAPPPA